VTSRFRHLLARRLPGRLLCRLPLRPCHATSPTLGRELVVVVSATPPHLRRLTVYRRLAVDPADPPRAA
jgi:hypothetical protein